MAKTVLLSGLIAPAPIYHPAMAAQDGPFCRSQPCKKKISQSSSAIGENYSSLGNWGRISRCHLTARSHHQEASYSLRSQGSWKGAAQSFQLRFNCSAEGGTQDIKREIFSIHVKGQKQLHPLMVFGFLMRHHLLSQLICFHLIIPYLVFFFNITVNYCAIIKVYFKNVKPSLKCHGDRSLWW